MGGGAATKGEAEALERAARPYLEEGFVERLVEGLRAAVGLRARGAILNPAHVAALLSCLLGFVTASGAAQAALLSQDRGRCGLLVAPLCFPSKILPFSKEGETLLCLSNKGTDNFL